MKIPDSCHYTETHEWARMEDDEVLVGITDYAQGELGDVVYVELPDIGARFEAGEECGMIDSAKTTSPILSPVAGTVVRINHDLSDQPELVNESPYGRGWMYALAPDDPADLDKLMGARAYEKFVPDSAH